MRKGFLCFVVLLTACATSPPAPTSLDMLRTILEKERTAKDACLTRHPPVAPGINSGAYYNCVIAAMDRADRQIGIVMRGMEEQANIRQGISSQEWVEMQRNYILQAPGR
jgi:hypothetical protein